MLHAQQVEELITLASTMDRESLGRQLMKFRGPFPVDFTPQFLQSMSLDRLRHIFVALCLQTRNLPSQDCAPAA